MENKHSSSGLAEDLIRSFVQIASAELHVKTLIEKRVSEIENGFYTDEEVQGAVDEVGTLTEEIISLANMRRSQMLYLYKLFGEKGDKEQWCMVKHLGMAMYTAFESWQASDDDPDLFDQYLEINRMFIKSVTKFIGSEITSCASCFSDILKAEESGDNK